MPWLPVTALKEVVLLQSPFLPSFLTSLLGAASSFGDGDVDSVVPLVPSHPNAIASVPWSDRTLVQA